MNNQILTFLLSIKGIGRKTLQKYFWDTDTNFDSSNWNDYISHLEHLRGKEIPQEKIEEAYKTAESIQDQNDQNNIKQCNIWDDNYPKLLKMISDPPLLLNYKGNINTLNKKHSIGIVGTREPSDHGFKVGKKLAQRLSAQDLNIVSGLALGCDTAGHMGALDSSGTTSAILAHGLDRIYPKSNSELAENILQNDGVLISEYFVGKRPFANQFIERNRIQAGLSKILIVIETGIKGGTIHTVNFAKEYRRLIFCYDQPEDLKDHPKSEGNQKLIRDNTALPLGNEEDLNKLLNSVFERELEINKQGELFIS